MSKKNIVIFVFIWLIIVAAMISPSFTKAQTPTKGKAIEWKVQDCFPSGFIYYKAGEYWAKKVNELSGGRLKVTYMPSGTIVGAFEVLQAVDKRVLDAGAGPLQYFQGTLSPAGMFYSSIPGDFGIYERLAWLYEGGGIQLEEEVLRNHNLGLVRPVMASGSEDFAWSNKPIKNLNDFKGLKFRSAGLWIDVLKRLGVSVVMLPGEEVFSALERGVLDATEYGTPALNLGLGVHEITKYVIRPGFHSPSTTCDLYVNKDSWKELPDDLKAIVEIAARDATHWSLRYISLKDVEANKIFENKVKIIHLDPEVLVEMKKQVDEVCKIHAAKDPLFAKGLKSRSDFHKVWKVWEENQVHKIRYSYPLE